MHWPPRSLNQLWAKFTGSPIQFLDAPEFQKYVDNDAKRLAEVVKKIGKVQ